MIVNTIKNEVLDKLENKNKDIRRKLTDTDKILNKTEINNVQKIFLHTFGNLFYVDNCVVVCMHKFNTQQ